MCRPCFARVDSAEKMRMAFAIPDYVPDEAIQADGGDDHPSYDHDYRCAICKSRLTDLDD